MKTLLSILLISPYFLLAQVQLLPSIGLSTPPLDGDPICFIQHISGAGAIPHNPPVVGDTMADFTLYNKDGAATTLSTLLNTNRRPVLIVQGSFTCPKYTGSVSVINDVAAQYPGEIDILVVYAVDAHPDSPDPSPYSGKVWSTTAPNGQDYNQAKTYGERKTIVNDMLAWQSINATVLLDGPCNEWWIYFTNWPNNAILVDTNGLIFSYHREFDDFYLDNSPADIFCDIDSILGNPTDCETANGTFTMQQLDTVVSGEPGETVHAYAQMINNSSSNVVVEFVRRINDIPSDWTTQMCAEICYGIQDDTGYANLDPGDTLLYNQYFNTGASEDSGQVRITFMNVNTPTNRFRMDFSANTKVDTTTYIMQTSGELAFDVYPNPFSHSATIKLPFGNTYQLSVFDLDGRQLLNEPTVNDGYQIKALEPGLYLLRLVSEKETLQKKLLVQ